MLLAASRQSMRLVAIARSGASVNSRAWPAAALSAIGGSRPSADARATCVERLHRGGDRTFDKIREHRGSCRLAGRFKLDVVRGACHLHARRKHAHAGKADFLTVQQGAPRSVTGSRPRKFFHERRVVRL